MDDSAGPSAAPLLTDEPPDVEKARAPPIIERRLSFDRTQTIVNTLHRTWSGHRPTFICWLLLSVIGIILVPFSDSLDAGESFVVSMGAWIGMIACVLYFLPWQLERSPAGIKRLATVILVLSVFTFVLDFPIFAGILWAMKNSDEGEDDDSVDDVLAISASVLFLHGCFAIVSFAKCMIVGTYEIPPLETFYDKR